MTLQRSIIGIGAAGLLLAGCGGGGGGATTAQTSTEPATTAPATTTTPATTTSAGGAAAPVEIHESEFKLEPATPKVKRGTVALKVTNRGKAVHALEVHTGGEEAETRRLQPGESQTLKVKFDKPGKYEIYCPVGDHEDRGMKGEITVE